MDKIKVVCLQKPSVPSDQMASFLCRVTQKPLGSIDEMMAKLEEPPMKGIESRCLEMGHGSVLRHAGWTLAIVGASRRFLAQITRHHVGINWVSASLQYQDMRGFFDPVIPPAVTEAGEKMVAEYLLAVKHGFDAYGELMAAGLDNDSAGYVAPQASRNLLIGTANGEAWANILRARLCRRNTVETMIVSRQIRECLIENDGFGMFNKVGPACLMGGCDQMGMNCGNPMDWSEIE